MELGRQEDTGVNMEMGGVEVGKEQVLRLFLYLNIVSDLELFGINYIMYQNSTRESGRSQVYCFSN